MSQFKGYYLPDDLYYTLDHAWVRERPNGVLEMGLTDFSQKMASTLTFVKLPESGAATKLQVPIFSFQSAKWVGWIKPAALGRVVSVNEELTEYPALVNEDPYGKGWVLMIEATEPIEKALSRLVHGKAALDWFEQEIDKHGG